MTPPILMTPFPITVTTFPVCSAHQRRPYRPPRQHHRHSPTGPFLPSTLHFDANPGFFAQATRITHQSIHDNYEQARVLHNTWNLAKNIHSIMVHLLAWGRGTKFTSGGEAQAMHLLQQDHGAVCHSKARCWVIHPHNAIVKGLAWSINATPPDL